MYDYLLTSRKITGEPCKLKSVIVSTAGNGPGVVQLYESRGAVARNLFARLLCPSNDSRQFTFDGLELTRGLYVEIVEKADFVTVEWEHIEG